MKNKLTDLPIELQHKITKYIPSTKQSYNKQIHKLSQSNYVYIITSVVGDFVGASFLQNKVFNKFEDALLYLFKNIKTNDILMSIIKNQIEDRMPNLNKNKVNLFIQNLNLETLLLLSDDMNNDEVDSFFYVDKGENYLEINATSISEYENIYRLSREFIN